MYMYIELNIFRKVFRFTQTKLVHILTQSEALPFCLLREEDEEDLTLVLST